jgi:hypothetical protein
MRMRKTSTWALKHPGDNPEQRVIRGEDTPDNREEGRREKETADMEERIRVLIEKELAALAPRQRGELAAYWIDVCKDEPDEVARALRYNVTTSAVRVAKLRALRSYPCGSTPGNCTPGCAHIVGEEVWKAIIRRVISELS